MQAGEEGHVVLSRRGLKRLKDGHLWVGRADVLKDDDAVGGAVVKLITPRGKCFGRAYYSDSSQIAIRLLARGETVVDRAFLGRRIDSALALRAHFQADDVSARRLVHGEADLLPGLVVDQYADVLVMQTTIQGTDRQKALYRDLLVERIKPRTIVERNDVAAREREGLEEVRGLIYGEEPGTVEVINGPIKLQVSPLEGVKTRTFLDQFENHRTVGSYIRPGYKALDCFTHTGGFALHMAKAGAQVTAIDSSKPAIEAARDSAARNELEVDWIEANAFDWLKEQSKSLKRDGERLPGTYDLVVLDPPAFAKTPKALVAARRGYKEINLRALQLLRSEGWLITCSCSHNLDVSEFMDVVLEAGNAAGRRLQFIERLGAARDHPALLGLPESRYLKALVFRVVD